MVSEVKIIPGYEDYECDIFGNVYSLKFGKRRKLKPRQNKGYLSVILCNNGKYKNSLVHRLILLVFHGKSDLQVNHINGIKEDNRLENLEYCTALENIRHAIKEGLKNDKGESNSKSYLTESEVIDIKISLLKPYHGINKDLAKKYGVCAATITYIKKGKRWSHVTID